VLEPLRNRTLSKTRAVEAASKHLGGGRGGGESTRVQPIKIVIALARDTLGWQRT
jgi:hypothetical protein